MDKLQAMGAFRAVLEAGSFARAAARLGLSPASTSRIVAELERELGLRLLHRTTRSLAPTDEGRVYYERCVRILDEVDDAERRLRESADVPRGTLRVTAAPAFGHIALAPLLPSFVAKYPGVQLSLNLEPRVVDIVREGFDLALRFRATDWRDSSLTAHRVATFENRFVASPAYFEARGRPTHPRELERHAVLVDWLTQPKLTFDGPDGRHVVWVDGPIRTDSSMVQRAAALAGVGIADLPDYVVRDDLASGALVEVFPDHRAPVLELWAVCPPRRPQPARVQAFVEHVTAGLAR